MFSNLYAAVHIEKNTLLYITVGVRMPENVKIY